MNRRIVITLLKLGINVELKKYYPTFAKPLPPYRNVRLAPLEVDASVSALVYSLIASSNAELRGRFTYLM